MTESLPPDLLITVCASCLRASCWHGPFRPIGCWPWDSVQMPLLSLRKLAMESPDSWERDSYAKEWRALDGVE